MNKANNFNDDRNAVFGALGDSSPVNQPVPIINKDVGAVDSETLARAFQRAAIENNATAEQLSDINAIPNAVKIYLQSRQLPLRIFCAESWQTLNWHNAGIIADNTAIDDNHLCGLTGIIAAAADCGAMMTHSQRRHQLLASLMPPHHIAIIKKSDIQPSLKELFALAKPSLNGIMSLLCGPSRTADIEQTLTLGMHGPLSVHVLIV